MANEDVVDVELDADTSSGDLELCGKSNNALETAGIYFKYAIFYA